VVLKCSQAFHIVWSWCHVMIYDSLVWVWFDISLKESRRSWVLLL
jgi:hypothetical protein